MHSILDRKYIVNANCSIDNSLEIRNLHMEAFGEVLRSVADLISRVAFLGGHTQAVYSDVRLIKNGDITLA